VKTRKEPNGRPYQTKAGKAAAAKRRTFIPPMHESGMSTREIAVKIFAMEDPGEAEMQMIRNDLRYLGLLANRSTWTPDVAVKNILPPRAPRVPVLLSDANGPCWDAVDDMGFSCCQACRGHGEVLRGAWLDINDKRRCQACKGEGWKRVATKLTRIPATAFARIGCALGNVMACGLEYGG